MTLRGKLLLAQLPLVIALALMAVASLYGAARFGAAPGEILHQNFRSFDAAHGMLRALDDIDRSILSANRLHKALEDEEIAGELARFERELKLAESNVTESGEAYALGHLRSAWLAYQSGVPRADDTAAFVGHQLRATKLRTAVNGVLDINRNAMHLKSDDTRSEATRIATVLSATAVAAFLLAVAVAGMWVRRILSPVRILERAVHRLAEGDFHARISIAGNDEIASLSGSFNEMASRLAEYRRSSLGELLDANNRLESVMDSLADAVVVYDLHGKPVANNEVAAKLFGEEKMGLDQLPEEIGEPLHDVFDRVRRTGEPHEPTSLEAAIEVPANPPRWILVSATPVRDIEGLAGVTIALRDVTRSRRIESFKGDLVAAAAHELRTPLTSLHMAIHLCLEEAAGPVSDQQRDLLAAARQDCERLQAVVEELLEMARLESGATRLEIAEVKIGELIREAVARNEPEARRQGCELSAVPGDSQLALQADAGRLGHVLDNLIGNALRHAGDAGVVQVGHESSGGTIRVFVDDAGQGIPDKLHERVFTKFYRVPGNEKQGSGLGLSIVQDIVRAHGGDVGIESSSLGGARFWFAIQVTAEHRS